MAESWGRGRQRIRGGGWGRGWQRVGGGGGRGLKRWQRGNDVRRKGSGSFKEMLLTWRLADRVSSLGAGM